jgi:hypothetical protein
MSAERLEPERMRRLGNYEILAGHETNLPLFGTFTPEE